MCFCACGGVVGEVCGERNEKTGQEAFFFTVACGSAGFGFFNLPVDRGGCRDIPLYRANINRIWLYFLGAGEHQNRTSFRRHCRKPKPKMKICDLRNKRIFERSFHCSRFGIRFWKREFLVIDSRQIHPQIMLSAWHRFLLATSNAWFFH